jgi:DNA-binding transcriptional LysR family regulator
MSELDDLRSLVEVLECGSFSAAAHRLGLSKSIISRRIARMEAEFGTRLLSRTTRGVSPTEAGLDLKARAERILADYEEARDAVTHRGGDVTGRLRLSVPLSFGVQHVAPLLAELAARHPGLEMDVSYSDRLVDLIGERVDAAIRIGTLPDSSLVARRVAPVHSVVVASPEYLARHGTPQTPDDLASHECLLYSGSMTLGWQFQSGRRTVSVRPNGRLRSDNGSAIVEWAKAGLGITLLPTFVASDAIEAGAVTPILRDHPTPEYGIYVLRPPGHYLPAKVRVLIDLLADRFGGRPTWDRCVR